MKKIMLQRQLEQTLLQRRLKESLERSYEFDGNDDWVFGSTFSNNIMDLIHNFTTNIKEDWWVMHLKRENTIVPLFIARVEVDDQYISSLPYCNHCSYMGWKEHIVCNSVYHLIIPTTDTLDFQVEEQKVFEDQSHLLHCLIHNNGYGHLLGLNGLQGGSKYFRGRELMDFAIRFCQSLRTRFLSVRDDAWKGSAKLRILYGVAKSQSWFSQWGFELVRGVYGTNIREYPKATNVVKTITLGTMMESVRNVKFVALTEKYQQIQENCLEVSSPFNHFGDLISFLLYLQGLERSERELAADVTERRKNHKELSKFLAEVEPELKEKGFLHAEVQDALDQIMEALVKEPMLLLAEILDRANCSKILVEYLLDSMGNILVGDYLVTKRVSETKHVEKDDQEEIFVTIEYRLEYMPYEDDVQDDLEFLYHEVLMKYPNNDVRDSIKTILNSKSYILSLSVKPQEGEKEYFFKIIPENSTDSIKPQELLILPQNKSIDLLMVEIENYMRGTYSLLEDFIAIHIEDQGGDNYNVSASGLTLGDLKFERGSQNWRVVCKCFADDDDGEEMLQCDRCSIWLHTACVGYDHLEETPQTFYCSVCTDPMTLRT